MRLTWAFVIIALFWGTGVQSALSQPAGTAQIDWQVANRFRLFAEQSDFDAQVSALQTAGGSVLALEQSLAAAVAGGKGWGNGLHKLCYDDWRGRIIDDCKRDGAVEKYLNPVSVGIRVSVRLPADFGDAACVWQIRTAGKTINRSANCREAIDGQRGGVREPSTVSVTAKNAAGRTLDSTINFQVRDILVVGMGDSIASGEGNPMKPIALADNGFCYRRILDIFSSKKFYLPARANAQVNNDCPAPTDVDDGDRARWDAAAAGWLFNPCHRSLYSYQARTALMLALQNPQVSVTYLPLGCTGATIDEGILGPQESRERPMRRGVKIGAVVESQLNQLQQYMLVNAQGAPFRPIDLLLLTIGANDIGFSELVANIIIKEKPERDLGLKTGIISTPDDARTEIKESLKPDFRDLRQALLPLMGGSLKKVLYTTYGNPGLFEGGKVCPSSRVGFDGHPAFGVDNGVLTATSKFVAEEFFPTLKSEATCASSAQCAAPDKQAMTFVDGHQTVFGDHGFCAKANDDPPFDGCFKNGGSFEDEDRGMEHPLTCNQMRPSQFPAYAKRARWIRTANDSYFAAMTFPTRSGPVASPTDIHDALWGLESVVYGGAIHPTAEGHAAMADAALPSARALLGLPPPP